MKNLKQVQKAYKEQNALQNILMSDHSKLNDNDAFGEAGEQLRKQMQITKGVIGALAWILSDTDDPLLLFKK